jgi:DNA (cytosine-5)-methyltransferase 1
VPATRERCERGKRIREDGAPPRTTPVQNQVSVLYNEIEPFAAEWVERLAEKEVIAKGKVDRRSIRDLTATDLQGYRQCHFFAGLGGWSYALRLAGWPDDAPVWTGSCPCQPFSVAGKHRGVDDERHLWPTWFNLIRQCRPPVLFGEQVASPDGLKWFDLVSTDLEREGYAVGAADLCAAGVGAPHLRQRLYFVAVADRKRLDGLHPLLLGRRSHQDRLQTSRSSKTGVAHDANRRPREQGSPVAGGRNHRGHEVARPVSGRPGLPWDRVEWLPCLDGKLRPVEPGTFPLAHGIPGRVGRVRAYGNAIVPQVAATFVKATGIDPVPPWVARNLRKTNRPVVRLILINGVRAKLEEMDNELVLDAIDEKLSFPDEGAAYKLRQASWRKWGYDGKKHLFSKTSLAFPIGFVDDVKSVLRKQAYRIVLVDQRKNLPKPGKPRKIKVELRGYQDTAVDAFLKKERGILKIPTAGGKSFTAAGIISRLGMPKTLFIVHKRNLASQARKALARAFGCRVKKIGQIGSGKWREKRVTVAILQTISSYFHLPKMIAKAKANRRGRMVEQMKKVTKFLHSIDFLILDETHHASSATWLQMANRCPARWRLGLSATPLDREDGRSPVIIGVTGPVLYQIRASTLIRQGKIAEPDVTFVPIVKCKRGKTNRLYDDAIDRYADWHTVYSKGIVNNKHRNWTALQLATKNPEPVMLLVQRIEHLNNLRDMGESIGIPVEVVHGRLPKEEQERILQRFKDGKIKRLVATTDLVGEGTDVPAIRTVIVCDGGKSVARTLQRIGRGMRMHGDKKYVYVYDFRDLTHRILTKHSEARLKAVRREGYNVTVEKT